MNKKMLFVLIIIVGLLVSGCIDNRNLQINTKYPILNIYFEPFHQDDVTVYYLNNNTINYIPIHLVPSLNDKQWDFNTRGNIIIDNESFLKVVWVGTRATEYSATSMDQTYNEIHVTKDDLKKFLRK